MIAPQQLLLIRERLASVESHQSELKASLPSSVEDYLKQRPTRRVVERLAQIVVESVTDTNHLLADALGLLPPSSAREALEMMWTHEVVDDYLLKRFQNYIGMRNLLVHDYDKIDNERIWYSSRQLVNDATLYIRQVRAYLARQTAKKRKHK